MPHPTPMGDLVKTVRRTRRTVRTAGLVAVAAAAAFSLTACQGGGKDDDAGSSSSAAPTQESGAKDSGSGDSDTKDSGSTGSGSTESGTSGNGGGSGNGGTQSGGNGGNGKVDTQTEGAASNVKRTTCTVATTTVRFQQTGGSMPVILLKATNSGSTRCDLYGYPFVGYPNAQSPIAVGGGKPQSVVSLEPGKSAYASLGLEEGNGADMHREKKLTVELANRNQQGTGATATLTAPGAGLALGDESTVSYWNTTPELAMQ
ncbi:DUF4232 domain-containing protein [Streptomyces iconiensis]|uniref:DUF4232 domain-containing protein n=1 Tax=Streptomyces iconiensis TaxID=1384038 RepID=A0ABT6ZSF6_9ACTN|nr:DUF4232 domain-containing protein [Streptomyces iconiensis]MDJ1131817.1 DUF4232 domain-containing protein [Streptomyces iconiensis]